VARAHPTPILSLQEDSFTAALAQLDPASRALLDLSLRRGMRPEEIGDLLGTDPESVIVARESALEQLAAVLGTEEALELDDLRGRLATLPSDAWTPPADDEDADLEYADDDEEPLPDRPAPAAVDEPRRKSRLPLLLALLAVAAVVLVIVLASGGSDDEDAPASAPAPAPQAQQPSASKPAAPATKPESAAKPEPTAGAKVPLAPVSAGAGAEGTASLLDGGKRLRLDVTGLRDGSYEVWLYDSVIEANLIGKGSGTKLALDLDLPDDASHYRYVDISREPDDGNPNHSGESVLRVPLAKLSR
jgi:hypothetical protein